MFDADCEVRPRALAQHVFRHGDEVAGANVTAAESGGSAEEAGHMTEFRIAWSSRSGIGKGRLDFAEQGIGLHHRDVETLDD